MGLYCSDLLGTLNGPFALRVLYGRPLGVHHWSPCILKNKSGLR